MKKLFLLSHPLRWSVLLTALSLIFFSACKDDDDPAPSTRTITQNIVNDNNFSLLEAALRRTNLLDDLEGTGHLQFLLLLTKLLKMPDLQMKMPSTPSMLQY